MRRRPRRRCAYNGLRVYEPVVRARRLRFCSSASGVTELLVADRPADDQREEASVKPLLGVVAAWGGERPRQDGEAAVSYFP